MLRKRINILTATSLLLLALSACGNAGASGDFSNGLVEVQFDLDEGTFDIVDVERGERIIEQSSMAFVLAE